MPLTLLSKMRNSPNPEVRFSEIEPALKQAILRFGSPHDRLNAHYPFWYLKTVGFWTLPQEEALKGEETQH
jgi:hypothetical protein